jgi:hypothetical protein
MLDTMTRMLYNAGTMNNKPNLPEEVVSWKTYSFRADMKVNSWLFVALLTSAASAFLFHTNPPYGPSHHCYYEDWPVVLRAVVELFPLLATLLWARSIVRWMRGMDELHRRIMLETWLIAAIATIYFLSIWHLLDLAGVSAAILRATHVHLEALDKPIFPLTIGMFYLFSGLGFNILNRRYQ